MQNCLPVKFQDVKFRDSKFMKFHENIHETLYFSKNFIICLPSFFSIIKVIIELFVV